MARSALTATFSEPYLVLSADGYRELIGEASDRGSAGGSIFDAIVAATARAYDATLLTCDERARPTYEAVGVRFEIVRSSLG